MATVKFDIPINWIVSVQALYEMVNSSHVYTDFKSRMSTSSLEVKLTYTILSTKAPLRS